jgi:hypothetical protein
VTSSLLDSDVGRGHWPGSCMSTFASAELARPGLVGCEWSFTAKQTVKTKA